MVDLIGDLVWPMTVLSMVLLFRRPLEGLVRAQGVTIEALGAKITLRPTKLGEFKRGAGDAEIKTAKAIPSDQPLPPDYFFLDHISFVRDEKQDQFKQSTKVYDYVHFDIRVIVNSFYEGALDQIICVEYLLHAAYPDPVQVVADSSSHFMLREVANGEYVLLARIYVRDRRDPVILSRYITLVETDEATWRQWLKTAQPNHDRKASSQ